MFAYSFVNYLIELTTLLSAFPLSHNKKTEAKKSFIFILNFMTIKEQGQN